MPVPFGATEPVTNQLVPSSLGRARQAYVDLRRGLAGRQQYGAAGDRPRRDAIAAPYSARYVQYAGRWFNKTSTSLQSDSLSLE
jgi:hypothetical protein